MTLSHADLILCPAGEVGDLGVLELPDDEPGGVALPGDQVTAVLPHLGLEAPLSSPDVVPGHHGLGVAAHTAGQHRPQSFPGVNPVAGGGHLGGVCNVSLERREERGERYLKTCSESKVK